MNALLKFVSSTEKSSDNLKLLYGYRCQIFGLYIGEEYEAHVVESHHIDYFIGSLNNDSENQLIVCPNHHRIIHYSNPVFEKSDYYIYIPMVIKKSLR